MNYEHEKRIASGVAKTYRTRLETGFMDRYLSGEHILDIGFRGSRSDALPIVPQAIGIDLNYPGYNGIHLPFPDRSQDAVHSNHSLEHIRDYRTVLVEWFRVLKVGGHLVIAVPHRWLYERKPTLPSRWGGPGHRRFYTAASLAREIEESLPVGEYRIRLLRDNDDHFNYAIQPEKHAHGCFEIELVVQKIEPPSYRDNLTLSQRARTIVASYEALVRNLVDADDRGDTIDTPTLEAFGRALPIPPYPVIAQLFPDVPDERLRGLLWPLVDPSVVDVDWYVTRHPDLSARVAAGDQIDWPQHYQRVGYFEWRLPRLSDPVYG